MRHCGGYSSIRLWQVCRRIEAQQQAAVRLVAGPLEPVSRNRELPLSYAQERLWFIDQMEAGNAVYNIPVGVTLDGELQAAALEQGLREVVRRHEVLRTSFVESGGHPQQVIMATALLALPDVDLSGLQEKHRQFVVRQLLKKESGQRFRSGRRVIDKSGLTSHK